MELRIDYTCINHHCSGFPSFSYFLIIWSIVNSTRGNVGFCTLPLKSARHNGHVVSGVVEAAHWLKQVEHANWLQHGNSDRSRLRISLQMKHCISSLISFTIVRYFWSELPSEEWAPPSFNKRSSIDLTCPSIFFNPFPLDEQGWFASSSSLLILIGEYLHILNGG